MATPLITSPSGQPASEFGFGTMQFGAGTPEPDCAEIYDLCRSEGVNVFDTAYVYTGGKSETILGKLIAQDRDDIVLMTKCAYTSDASGPDLVRQFDESRKRLDQDMVDVLFLHKWDDTAPLEVTFETFASFKEKGHIRAIGVSNFAAWQVVKAQSVARHFDLSIHVIQPMYNLVKRQAEVEILPMCASEGIAVTPYSPLGGGLLTGKYGAQTAGRLIEDDRYAARYDQDWFRKTAQDLTDTAGDLGVHPATLAVAWCAKNPDITAPLISGRTVAQLRPSLDAIRFNMPDELYERITALSQTPPPATDRLEET